MKTSSLTLCGIAFTMALFGCSGPDAANEVPPGTLGGSEGKGGSLNGFGGLGATGGSKTGIPVAGGRASTGGSSGTSGSTDAQGGYLATGGSSTTQRTSATGGNEATGGAVPTGGRDATAGATAIGGAAASGGMPATGGGSSNGGKSTSGGTKASGGAPASGGSVTTGGTTATAGSKATGGTSAAGSNTAPTTLKKFVGNITTGNSVDPSGLKFSKYWDQITPENQGKWGSVQQTPTSAFNWATLDSIYSYAQTNNVIFKQHTFVWGTQQPNPMNSITLAQVENWIKSFCERYPDTRLIDVVNEPPPHTTPGYTAALGAGEKGSYPWITKAFKLARQYCGNAILILNDYNNIEYGTDEDRFIAIVKDIKANGAPIDAVGAQSHALKGKSASTTKTNLDKLHTQTGLPVYITEFDIDDGNDSSQSTAYQNLISMFLDTDYVDGITVWGWIAGRTWMTNSGIVNGTTPRPAMTWLMQKLGRPVPPN